MEQHSTCAGAVVGSLACGSVEVACGACGGGVASAACGEVEVAGTEKHHRGRDKNKCFHSHQTKEASKAEFQRSAMQFNRADQLLSTCYLQHRQSTCGAFLEQAL